MEAVERESEPDTDDRWASARDMSLSVKLAAKILDYEGTLIQGQIAEESLLPLRTIRYVLSRLGDEGAVDLRSSFSGARKRLYTLNI